ncbi:hypothetical protein D3C72_404810 [compost metagenome]
MAVARSRRPVLILGNGLVELSGCIVALLGERNRIIAVGEGSGRGFIVFYLVGTVGQIVRFHFMSQSHRPGIAGRGLLQHAVERRGLEELLAERIRGRLESSYDRRRSAGIVGQGCILRIAIIGKRGGCGRIGQVLLGLSS